MKTLERLLTALAAVIGIASPVGAYLASNKDLLSHHPYAMAVSSILVVVAGAIIGFRAGKREERSRANRVLDQEKARAIRVLTKNEAMHREVSELIDRKGEDLRKVIVIQYSGINVVSTVREIYSRTAAEIEVYLVHPSQAAAVNGHQGQRVNDWRRQFRNELQKLRSPGGSWRQFTYNAPGSIRAVLIEGQILFLGPYFYEVVEHPAEHSPAKRELDIRGGDMPLLAIPVNHPGFETPQERIQEMVSIWKEERDSNGRLTGVMYDPHSETAGA